MNPFTFNFNGETLTVPTAFTDPIKQKVLSGQLTQQAALDELTGVLTKNAGTELTNQIGGGRSFDSTIGSSLTQQAPQLYSYLSGKQAPTQYVPGSLQPGQTAQVVPGTAQPPVQPTQPVQPQAQPVQPSVNQVQPQSQADILLAQAQKMVTPGATPQVQGYTGPSIVDFLNSTGQNSSFASRKALAEQNGITGYVGSATQNTQLLNALRSRQPTIASPALTAGSSVTTTPPVPTNTASNNGVPVPNTPQGVMDLYSGLFKSSGLSDLKSQIDSASKAQTDLEMKITDEKATINDNPWLTEGERVIRNRKIDEKYATKLDILINQQKRDSALYDNGVQQIQFLTGQIMADQHAQEALDAQVQQNAIENAQKALDAQNALTQQAFDNSIKSRTVAVAEGKAGTGGSSSGTYTPGNNIVVDSWAERIQNGTAKITDIPASQASLRNQVTVALQAMGNSIDGKPTTTELGKAALATAQGLLSKFNSGKGTSAVGKSGLLDSFGFGLIPGTDRANFVNDFNSLKSQLSLEGVKYLKGQGQVSDAERALLAAAVTNLNLTQSESEFRTTLQGIIDRLSGTSVSTPSSNEYSSYLQAIGQ